MQNNVTPELIKALILAQAEMADPIKNASNPAFKGSKFADLGAHLDAVREPLRKHGLTLVQTLTTVDSVPTLETIVLHAAGGCLVSAMPLMPERPGMQGMGSALTYARRYAIGAMFSIYGDVDDDANGSEATGPQAAPSNPIDTLFANAKDRISKAKDVATLDKVLALCTKLPAPKLSELTSLAKAKGETF